MRIRRRFSVAILLLLILSLSLGCGIGPEPIDPAPSVPEELPSSPGPDPEVDIDLSQEGEPEEPASGEVLDQVPYDKSLAVHFIDVGQGDGALIQLPTGETILIDGGDRHASARVTGYLADLGIEHIDYLVGTHPHADHIGGLIQVIREFSIGQIIMPKIGHNTKTYLELLETIQEKGLKITAAKAGLELDLGEGLAGRFVAPVKDDYSKLNDHSAVLRLTYGQISFLFTGDAEVASELDMLASGEELNSQVLKVGHHGSGTSTSQKFLTAVEPELAVISAGRDNSYGHPHQEIVERLEWNEIEILRTDLLGTIILITQGEKIDEIRTPDNIIGNS